MGWNHILALALILIAIILFLLRKRYVNNEIWGIIVDVASMVSVIAAIATLIFYNKIAQDPKPTYTPIFTPTYTPTFSPTYTPTLTPSATFTPTPTFTPTAIPLPTITLSVHKPLKGCETSHLYVGDAAYVPPGDGSVSLRPNAEPDLHHATEVAYENETMLIVEGPECKSYLLLWEVITDRGIRDWVPEGNNEGDFFILPLPAINICNKPYTRASILKKDGWAYLPKGEKIQYLYNEPGIQSQTKESIKSGETLKIIEGPICIEDIVWWKAQIVNSGSEGWIAEGDKDSYWFIPLFSPWVQD